MVDNIKQSQSQRVPTQPASERTSANSVSSRPPRKRSFWHRYKLLIYSIFFALLSLASLTFFTWLVFSLNIFPLKYLIPGYIILIIIYILLFVAFFKRRLKFWLRVTAYVISAIISALLIAASVYLFGANHFLEQIQVGDYDTISYSVLVQKDSSYQDIEDLSSQTIGLMGDKNQSQVEEALEQKISFTPAPELNSNSLAQQLVSQKLPAICLEQGYINMLSEEVKDFESSTRVIYTFEIQVPAEQATADINPTEQPFILYISGIDQYGDVETARGRSDVNQLAVVNPKTHQILLLNTPRDYYVQLAGTTGLKDKLTHAGIYGIDESMNTLDDLYGITINYYIRVDFDSLIDLVDEIGGIDINSDTDFVAHTNHDVHIHEGLNHLDGAAALAYSRERFAYASGDRHRGENQQQVIQAIIDKVTSSPVILTNYNGILDALGGTFQTDMPSGYIADFVKMQVDEMPSWQISNFSVDGTGAMEPTYSMGPDLPLYVMIPNQTSIDTAKEKINAILNA